MDKTIAARMDRGAPPRADAGWLRGAVGLAAVALGLFGFLYALTGVGLGQALFPFQAGGSLLRQDGAVRGSALVAQPFAGEGYFSARPSAAAYDPMALAGSNQARGNPALRERMAQARAAIAAREGVAPGQVPAELLTQSGSGIDPHVSPQAARIQAARVARARGMTEASVRELIARHTEPPQWGVFGQARVNVLALNLALDARVRGEAD